MYFSKFPTGNYDMKGDGNQKLVTDLMKELKSEVRLSMKLLCMMSMMCQMVRDQKQQHSNTLVILNSIG
jgi:NAD(P)H-flavin reductase